MLLKLNKIKKVMDIKVSIGPYIIWEYLKFNSNYSIEKEKFNKYIPSFSNFIWINFKGKMF